MPPPVSDSSAPGLGRLPVHRRASIYSCGVTAKPIVPTGNRQARENRLQQAMVRAMRELNDSIARTPAQYEQTAKKLEAVFDSAAKLYTAVQLEQIQKLEPGPEPQQSLG